MALKRVPLGRLLYLNTNTRRTRDAGAQYDVSRQFATSGGGTRASAAAPANWI